MNAFGYRPSTSGAYPLHVNARLVDIRRRAVNFAGRFHGDAWSVKPPCTLPSEASQP